MHARTSTRRASPPPNLRGRRLLLLTLAGAVWGLAGCQETRIMGFYRPLPPKPRPLKPAPQDARADALVLNVSPSPLDTNGNGYPDLIQATAHLFDTRYRPAIHEDGAFVFLLYAPGEVGAPDSGPIRTWRIEDEELTRSRFRSAFGACYQFRPSLLDDGTDVLPFSTADLVCYFEPADGRAPVYASQVSALQVGRRVLIPNLKWRQRTGPDAEAPEPAPG